MIIYLLWFYTTSFINTMKNNDNNIIYSDFILINNIICISYTKKDESFKTFYRKINQQIGYSVFSLRYIDLEKSETIKLISNMGFPTSESSVPPSKTVYSDIIRIDSTIIENLYFYGVNNIEDNYNKEDYFSLAFHVDNQNFSLVHILYKNNLIPNFQYAFVPTSKDFGKLYFGGIPEKEINKMKYKGKCDLQSERWGCQIRKICIKENNCYNANNVIIFQFAYLQIHSPLNFIYYLRDQLNNKGGNLCDLHKTAKFESVSCSNTIFHNQNISFVIGNYLFQLKLTDIFFCWNDICLSTIKHFYKYNKTNIWIFGYDFFKFYYSVFDYTDKSVTFYSNKYILNITKENSKIYLINIFLINIAISIIDSILIIFFKIRNKNIQYIVL